MMQQDKNGIFNLLRTYHESPFSITSTNSVVMELATELEKIQEQVVSMVLGFVYGRSEFVDFSNELNIFDKKVKAHAAGTQVDEDDKGLISGKVEQLITIVKLAQKSVVVQPAE